MSTMTLWLMVGFLGQLLFTARFLIQWVMSEKNRTSMIPAAFWWLSLLGGVALLAYAIARRNPVIVTGQAIGLFVYVRNLMLMTKRPAENPQPRCGPRNEGILPLYPRTVSQKVREPV